MAPTRRSPWGRTENGVVVLGAHACGSIRDGSTRGSSIPAAIATTLSGVFVWAWPDVEQWVMVFDQGEGSDILDAIVAEGRCGTCGTPWDRVVNVDGKRPVKIEGGCPNDVCVMGDW